MSSGYQLVPTRSPDMAGHAKTSEDNLGMRLVVEGKRTLTIGTLELRISASTSKKSSRSSCAPLSSGAHSATSIPFHNIIWVDVRDGVLEIDYARQASSTKLVKATLSFGTLAAETAPAEQPDLNNFVRSLMQHAYNDAKRCKRAYILVNPHSGPGKAWQQWEQDVKPLFEAAKMTWDVVKLTRGGEATELVEKMDLEKYDTVTACSGDGTPYEVFNGLANRPDAGKALRSMPVSHLPCGSGNAISGNIYGSHNPTFAALGIIKGVITPLDLTSITQGDKRYVSALSQNLGIIAEADLDTEGLRWMGSMRFDVGVVQRIFQKKSFPCELAVKVEVEDKEDIKLVYAKGRSGRGGTPHEPLSGDGLPALKYGTVKDALPEDWKVEQHDDVGCFYAGNMAYMAPKTNFFPAALPSDGMLDLVTISGRLPLMDTVKVFLSVETEDFYDNPNVNYRKISAYRVTPKNQKDGCISIDGERVPFEPFQAEVHRGLGRVLVKPKLGTEEGQHSYEAPGPKGWIQKSIDSQWT